MGYQYLHLVNLEELSVLLEENLRKKIIDQNVKIYGSQRKMANKLKIGQYTISRWRNGKFFISVEILLKLLKKMNINPEKIEDKILKIGSSSGSNSFEIKLPLKIDEDLGYLLGLIITDGHIDKNLSWIQFTNKEEKLKSIFLEKMKKVFNYNGYYRPSNKDDINIYIKNKVIANIIWRIGISKGNKTKITKVPESIFNSPDSVISSFLKGCFDGDGSVAYTPRQGLRIINFASSSIQILKDVNKMLSKFGIENSISINKYNNGYINITNRRNLENFAKLINFNHPKRAEKLNYILKTYQRYNEIHKKS